MNILHINTEKTWRGGERQTYWLAQELKRRGHGSFVACRPGYPLEERCRKGGLETIPLKPWGEIGLLTTARLKSVVLEKHIQILHAHTGRAVGLGALAALGTPVPVIATRRVDFPLKNKFFTQWKYRRMTRLVAISHKIEDILLQGGLAPAKMAVIPSGIDPARYPSRDKRESLRKEKGFSPEDLLVVQAAALVPHKDQATLLRAAVQVCAQEPRVRFLILGDGPLAPALTSQAQELGLGEKVSFLGHRSDVLEIMALGDLFVLSSQEEGLGTALLDAFALGLPTVATQAGGIPELFSNQEKSHLVPVGDHAQMAQEILTVLQSPQEAQRRREAGLEQVKNFSVISMTERYENLYNSLVATK